MGKGGATGLDLISSALGTFAKSNFRDSEQGISFWILGMDGPLDLIIPLLACFEGSLVVGSWI